MSITNVFKTIKSVQESSQVIHTRVIHEGPYDLDDETSNDNVEQDNNQPEEDTVDTDTENDSVDGDEGDPEAEPEDDNSWGNEGTDDNIDDNSWGNESSDEEESNHSVSDINVLSLTEQEKHIANLKLVTSAKELKSKISSYINRLNGSIDSSESCKRVISTILNNLEDLINDIDMFIKYRLSESYETNFKIYLGLLNRFKEAHNLYVLTIEEYSKEKDKVTN